MTIRKARWIGLGSLAFTLFGAFSPASAAITSNALTQNALGNNSLTSNALTTHGRTLQGGALADLNGVAVEDVAIPAR